MMLLLFNLVEMCSLTETASSHAVAVAIAELPVRIICFRDVFSRTSSLRGLSLSKY